MFLKRGIESVLKRITKNLGLTQEQIDKANEDVMKDSELSVMPIKKPSVPQPQTAEIVYDKESKLSTVKKNDIVDYTIKRIQTSSHVVNKQS